MIIEKSNHNFLNLIIALSFVCTSSCKKNDDRPLSKPQLNSSPTELVEIKIRRTPSVMQEETHRLIATYTTDKSCCTHHFGIGTICPRTELPLKQESPLQFTAQLDLFLPGECKWHLGYIRDPIWINNQPHALVYLKKEDLERASNRYKCYETKTHGMECVNLERTTITWDTTNSPLELQYLIQQK